MSRVLVIGEIKKDIDVYGQPKFWNELENDAWNRYHIEWNAMM